MSPAAVLAEYRVAGYGVALLRGYAPVDAVDDEIMRFCDSAGPDGQANLLLSRC